MNATTKGVTFTPNLASNLRTADLARLRKLRDILNAAGWADLRGREDDDYIFAHAPTADECPWLTVRPNAHGATIYHCWVKPEGWLEESCAETSDVWLALWLIGVSTPEGVEL